MKYIFLLLSQLLEVGFAPVVNCKEFLTRCSCIASWGWEWVGQLCHSAVYSDGQPDDSRCIRAMKGGAGASHHNNVKLVVLIQYSTVTQGDFVPGTTTDGITAVETESTSHVSQHDVAQLHRNIFLLLCTTRTSITWSLLKPWRAVFQVKFLCSTNLHQKVLKAI